MIGVLEKYSAPLRLLVRAGKTPNQAFHLPNVALSQTGRADSKMM